MNKNFLGTEPVGKLLIQSSVNTLGVSVIAAYNAVTRVDDFAFTPEQSISHAMTTFIAQNRGAKNYDRMQEGFRKGLVLEACYFVLIASAVLLFNRPIMSLFISGEGADAVIQEGHLYLSTMAFFYIFPKGKNSNGFKLFIRLLWLVPGFLALGHTPQFIWTIVDIVSGFWCIPNCIALLALSGVFMKIYRDYNDKYIYKTKPVSEPLEMPE